MQDHHSIVNHGNDGAENSLELPKLQPGFLLNLLDHFFAYPAFAMRSLRVIDFACRASMSNWKAPTLDGWSIQENICRTSNTLPCMVLSISLLGSSSRCLSCGISCRGRLRENIL